MYGTSSFTHCRRSSIIYQQVSIDHQQQGDQSIIVDARRRVSSFIIIRSSSAERALNY
jgi:chemotaxis regulatin CheY-phosphate phosphatase CheZ